MKLPSAAQIDREHYRAKVWGVRLGVIVGALLALIALASLPACTCKDGRCGSIMSDN